MFVMTDENKQNMLQFTEHIYVQCISGYLHVFEICNLVSFMCIPCVYQVE